MPRGFYKFNVQGAPQTNGIRTSGGGAQASIFQVQPRPKPPGGGLTQLLAWAAPADLRLVRRLSSGLPQPPVPNGAGARLATSLSADVLSGEWR